MAIFIQPPITYSNKFRRDDILNDKIVLVSGDGDYKLLVDFLIEEKKFKKILFPNKKFASSLYRQLGSELFDWLENKSIKQKIMRTKRKGLLR